MSLTNLIFRQLALYTYVSRYHSLFGFQNDDLLLQSKRALWLFFQLFAAQYLL